LFLMGCQWNQRHLLDVRNGFQLLAWNKTPETSYCHY
jgi:hypothetical protein